MTSLLNTILAQPVIFLFSSDIHQTKERIVFSIQFVVVVCVGPHVNYICYVPSEDKKLQGSFKKMGLNQIPGIEEVNMFTEHTDDGVGHVSRTTRGTHMILSRLWHEARHVASSSSISSSCCHTAHRPRRSRVKSQSKSPILLSQSIFPPASGDSLQGA